jgi:hypothetical protein
MMTLVHDMALIGPTVAADNTDPYREIHRALVAAL